MFVLKLWRKCKYLKVPKFLFNKLYVKDAVTPAVLLMSID